MDRVIERVSRRLTVNGEVQLQVGFNGVFRGRPVVGKYTNRKSIWKEKGRADEVVEISKKDFKKIKKEAFRVRFILQRDVIKALDKGNEGIIIYVVNRLERIWKCVPKDLLEKVIEGDNIAVEKTYFMLLNEGWDGPIVKFKEIEEQRKVIGSEDAIYGFLNQMGSLI